MTAMVVRVEEIECPHCGGEVPFDAERSYATDVEMAEATSDAIVTHLGVCPDAPPGAVEAFLS